MVDSADIDIKSLPGFEKFSKDYPLLGEGFKTASDDSTPGDVLDDIVAKKSSDATFLNSVKTELGKWTSGTQLQDDFATLLRSATTAQTAANNATVVPVAAGLAETFRALAPTLQVSVDDALAALNDDSKSGIESFFTKSVAGLPTWAWFLIGFGVLLLLLLLIAAMVSAAKRRNAEQERAQRMSLLESRYPPLSAYPNPYQ